jgi:SAM-dependent methyltransferase
MKIPWLRHNFLARRTLDRWFLDPPDALIRRLKGRGDLPPYSLRSFVGGAENFEEAGRFFLEDFLQQGLVSAGTTILEIGCGCGRVATSLARDERIKAWGVSYSGMDVDEASIAWCAKHITRWNPLFHFYHANCYNPSYNPSGVVAVDSYRFPHADESLDLVVLTSVLTHVLPNELIHYLGEMSRMLAPDGVVYASFFLSPILAEADNGRHAFSFPVKRENHAVNREDFPTNAVAYEERYVRRVVQEAGLQVLEPVRYGSQDIMLLTKPIASIELREGWYELETNTWRWTTRSFGVKVKRRKDAFTLRFRFRIAEALLENDRTLRLSAAVGESRLQAVNYSTVGEHLYVQKIPPPALGEEWALIHFQIESAYEPATEDRRELGVQVIFRRGLRPLCPVSIT